MPCWNVRIATPRRPTRTCLDPFPGSRLSARMPPSGRRDGEREGLGFAVSSLSNPDTLESGSLNGNWTAFRGSRPETGPD